MMGIPAMADEMLCSTGDFIKFSSFRVSRTPRFMPMSMTMKMVIMARKGRVNQG